MTTADSRLAHAAQDFIDRGDPGAALALLDSRAADAGADALAARATAHLALGEGEKALAAARASLAIDPSNAAALFNAGRALMMIGEPEAAVAPFEAAERAFPNVGEVAARLGEAAYLAGDDDRAEPALRRALARAPGHPGAFHLLTEILAQRTDHTALDSVLKAAAQRGGPSAFRAASAFNRLDRREEALEALLRAEAVSGRSAPTDMLAAEILRLQGDIKGAFDRARSAAARAPADPEAAAPLARLLLADGALAQAEVLSRRILAADPSNQLWLALLWTALAARGDDEADSLLDFERDVAVVDLDPPGGFADIAAFNAALAAELAPLHRAAGPPLGQSVHGGSQTRRPLQTMKSPALSAFFTAALDAGAAFAAASPDAPAHPFRRRRPGALRVTGAWSVLLAPGGRHVAHVHPGGWASSAYYVEAPAAVSGDDAGRLALGLPPFSVPGIGAPRRVVDPKPGRLVLFPSYCWHGTTPFAAPGRRLTIAFDLAQGSSVR